METRHTLPLPAGFADPYALAGVAEGTPLAVAFSGGADSLALLLMLSDRPNVCAVHVHHGIRGAEADRDAAFCRETAERLGVPFTLLTVDAPALAAESGESIETAARRARYDALETFLTKRRIPLLATAHHADDQLETLLQHLTRGSGLRGMCGIPAVRPLGGARVVRPLLGVAKEELLAYVGAAGFDYVTDSTNETACCQRNRLRHTVLPALTAVVPHASVSAARCAALLSEDEAYLTSLAEDFLKTEGEAPRVEALRTLPRPVFVRVLRTFFPRDPAAVHFAAAEEFVRAGKPHASLSLPSLTLTIEQGRLAVKPPADGAAELPYDLPLREGGNEIPCGLVFLTNGETPAAPPCRFAASVAFPADAVCGTLRVRSRREGDRVRSGGMHKSVRKLPGLASLPPDVRARMPLLADDDGILAVPFGRGTLPLLRDGVTPCGDTLVFFYFD